MKTSLTLTASLPVISQIIALLDDHGFADAIPMGDDDDPNTPVITPPVAAAGAAAGIELDGTGLPWDERIHSSNRQKKADGSWHKRKSLADGVYEQVEAELRARFPTQAAAPQPIAAPVPVPAPVVTASPVVAASPAPVSPPTPMPVPVAAPQPVPVAPTAPVPPTPMPVPVAVPAVFSGPPTNVNELMAALGPLMESGTILPDYIIQTIGEVNTAFATHFGGQQIASLADLAAFPNMGVEGYIWQIFQRDGKVPA